MNLKRVALAIACLGLIVTLIGCFAAQMYEQKIFNYSYRETPFCQVQVYSGIASLKAITINQYCLFAFPPTDGATQISQPSIANVTREQIFNYINENPGIQFRAICTGLCLPVGLVQYYVSGLIKSGLVTFFRDGKYKRFFVSKRYANGKCSRFPCFAIKPFGGSLRCFCARSSCRMAGWLAKFLLRLKG